MKLKFRTDMEIHLFWSSDPAIDKEWGVPKEKRIEALDKYMDAMEITTHGPSKWVHSILTETLNERYIALHYWGDGKK